VKLFTGVYVQMNPMDLFVSLIKLIILPFIAAELVRRYAKRAAAVLSRNSAPVNNICIFFVIFGVISDAAGGIWGFGWLAVIVAAYTGICYALGYFSSRRESMALGFSNGFRNGTLAMVVALEVFGPMAAMIGVMTTLVHNIILVPVMFWGKKTKGGAH
jgi:predicted Na+-dependent transporter